MKLTPVATIFLLGILAVGPARTRAQAACDTGEPFKPIRNEVTFVSSGGNATLIGYSEYAQPSTPPKKYRRQVIASGAPFVTCYALPANCGAPGCPPSVSLGWTGKIPGSGDTFAAGGNFTLVGVANGVATYSANGLFARRLNPGGVDEIIGARITGDPVGGVGFSRFDGQTIALPVGVQVAISLQVNWVQWTSVGTGGCIVAGGATFAKTADTWHVVSQFDATTGAFSEANTSSRVTGSGSDCAPPAGPASALTAATPATFYGAGVTSLTKPAQRTSIGVGCVQVSGGVYNNYAGAVTETLDDEDTELAAENRARSAGNATVAYRTSRGNGFSWSFQTFAYTTFFEIKCPGKYDVTVHYTTKPHGAVGPVMSQASVVTIECETGVQKIEGAFTADQKDVDYTWERIEARRHCDAAPPGAGNFALGSVKLGLSLGQGVAGFSAGDLLVEATLPTAALYTPESLVVATPPGGGTEIVRDGSNRARQVRAAQVFADVVILGASSYEVRFYPLGQVGVQDDVARTYALTGSPFATYKFENPDAPEEVPTRLRISETRGAATKVTEYAYDERSAAWSLSTGSGLRKETQVTATENGNRVTTSTVRGESDQVVGKVSRVYRTFPWGEEQIAEVLDPDGAALTTTYDFYDAVASTDPNYGRLKQQTAADGSWERYTYDASRRVLKMIRPFLDAAPTTTNEALCRVTENLYDTIADADGDGAVEQRMTTIDSMLGQETGRRYRIDWSKDVMLGSDLCHRRSEIVCTVMGAAWEASTNLVTETLRYATGAFVNRERRAMNPDGTATLTTFVLDASGQTITTTRSGQPNAERDDIVDGTRSVTITGAANQVISEATVDVASGLLLLGWAATEFDTMGRPTGLDYADGTFVARSFACCGLASERDRSGLATTYGYDALGRLSTTTRLGVTAKTAFNADGRVKTVSRIGADETEIVQEANDYDLAGRLKLRRAALDRATAFAETIDGTTGRATRTTTNPDGGTIVEVFARDGSKLSIDGTATSPHRYAYGIDVNGVFTEDTAVGLDATSDQPITTEWTKTYVDFAGRTRKTVFADGATSELFYNGAGQLARRIGPDGVTTLFAYNARGELETTAIDLNANNVIDLAGTDRVTRTMTAVAAKSDENTTYTVYRTVTQAWETNDDNTPTTVAVSEEGIDGLHSWQTVRDATTKGAVTLDGRGGRTVTTTAPDGTRAVQVVLGDRPISVSIRTAADVQLAATNYDYDAHGRLRGATDARNGTTTFSYYPDDQIRVVTSPDPDTTRTGPGYDPQITSYDYDSAGRVQSVTQPDGGVVTMTYWPTGAIKRATGARTYPVEYGYDPQGRLKTLTTWQDYAANSGKAVTRWNYEPLRGLLQSKRYADNSGPSYTYESSGRVHTRTWARTPGIVATYRYNAAGDLAQVEYSDGTPGVSLNYDRVGRLESMTDAAGSRKLTYHASGQLADETYAQGMLSGFTIGRSFDGLQRLERLVPGPAPAIGYGYDAASRLASVTVGENTALYGYAANSGLVANIAFRSGGATRLTTEKAYDRLNRLTSIANTPLAAPVTSYSYVYNHTNQRLRATREDGAYWSYGYDSLGQVTSGGKFLADDRAALGLDFAYAYDDIGNRKNASVNGRTSIYQPTLLNQYADRAVPGAIEVAGAAAIGTTVTVSVNNGLPQATTRQGEAFYRQLDLNNAAAAQYPNLKITGVKGVAGPDGEDVVSEVTRAAHLPQSPERFTYDADGNLTEDARWHYTWDGENRLVALQTSSVAAAAGVPPQRLEFVYDGLSRRVEKKVSRWDGVAWSVSSQTHFLYDAWNLVAELDALNHNALIRAYVWGLDLSGTAQGAGGVGGLLSVADVATNAVHFVGYDGNGNVSTLTSATTGTLSARYDYHPFGEPVLVEGSAATLNPFGFSTKYRDSQTGHLYYSYRYYAPENGRWLSRDGLEEVGGLNLFGFCHNAPTVAIDPQGLKEEISPGVFVLSTGYLVSNASSASWDGERGWILSGLNPAEVAVLNLELAVQRGDCQTAHAYGESLRPYLEHGLAGMSPAETFSMILAGAHDPETTAQFLAGFVSGQITSGLSAQMTRVPRSFGPVGRSGRLTTVSQVRAACAQCSVTTRSAAPKAYSVAYRTRLAPESYPGVSRPTHFQEANGNLLRAMEEDTGFAKAIGDLGVSLKRTPTGLAPRKSPVGWTWHHADSLGEMRLVPRTQHTFGSVWWGILHPGGGGGYSIWGK